MRLLVHFSVYLGLITVTMPLSAQIERFPARDGEAIELWRITHDPLVRDHANYHNTQCWSPDGRYLSYVHYAANEKEYGAQSASEVHLFDLLTQKDTLIDRGDSPRWANQHNWLFYARFHAQDGPKSAKGTQVLWLDLDTGRKTRIAYGVSYFKETGLQSERSRPLEIHSPSTLRIVDRIPPDFSWTHDRYWVDGKEVSAEEAVGRTSAIREVVHLHDGVIHREWLQQGQVQKRHDLNADGKPIRQLTYQGGKLVKREYYRRDLAHVSTELFDSEGSITESIHGRNHWWYDRGVPQKFESRSSLLVKEGDRWIRKR